MTQQEKINLLETCDKQINSISKQLEHGQDDRRVHYLNGKAEVFKYIKNKLKNSTQIINVGGIDKPVLNLTLAGKWFDMIKSGKKTEEYREIKDYWSRIFGAHIKIKDKLYHPKDVVIKFTNGYDQTSPQMWVECTNIKTSTGKEEWGAEAGKQYYCLMLGEIIKTKYLKPKTL